MRRSRMFRWRVLSWSIFHALVAVHVVLWLRQGKVLAPVEVSETMRTLELGQVNPGFLVLAFGVLLTLVLGRFFCGWACHWVAYQDLCSWILRRMGLRPRPIRMRLLALVPAGAALYMFVWPQIERLLEDRPLPALAWHLTTRDLWANLPSAPIALLTILICGAFIVVILGNKGFCTYACPYGALFGRVDRLAPGKIVLRGECIGCGHCTATCTSNIPVHEEVKRHASVQDPRCFKCFDCVSVCPVDALRYGFSRPSAFLDRAGGVRPSHRYDFSWREEIAMAILFLGSLYAFRGLYDAVPFLLALGLSALAAYFAVVWFRLWSAPHGGLQWIALRRAGRFTKAGVLFQAVGVLLFAVEVHSGWIQYHAREAGLCLARAGSAHEETAMRSEARKAEAHFAACLDHGLFEPASWHLGLGSIHAALGETDSAERELRRALEIAPKLSRAHVSLADIAERRGDRRAAIRHLAAAAEVDPELALRPLAVALEAGGTAEERRAALELLDQYSEDHPTVSWARVARDRLRGSLP